MSGIVSTGLQCENELCPTEDLKLESPILITIQHSDSVKVCVCVCYHISIPVLINNDVMQIQLMFDNTLQIRCVFWQFLSELK